MFTSVSVIAFVSSSLATVVIVDTLAADNKGSVIDVNVPCPPWYQYDATKQQCVCHEAFHQKIMCSDQGALLEMGSCTTHNRDKGTVIAQCLYKRRDTKWHLVAISFCQTTSHNSMTTCVNH